MLHPDEAGNLERGRDVQCESQHGLEASGWRMTKEQPAETKQDKRLRRETLKMNRQEKKMRKVKKSKTKPTEEGSDTCYVTDYQN